MLFGWAVIVAGSAVLPVEELGLRTAALFLHVVFVPIGFGAVVMMNVYTVLWLLGRHHLRGVVALTVVAHRLMAAGLAGLIASGLALDPDLGSTLMRVKLVLLLVLMLNAARVQRSTGNLEASRADGALRRIVLPAVVSQLAWWGAIGIGFVTTTAR